MSKIGTVLGVPEIGTYKVSQKQERKRRPKNRNVKGVPKQERKRCPKNRTDAEQALKAICPAKDKH